MISEYYNLMWSIIMLIMCGVLIYGIILVMYDIGYYIGYHAVSKILYPAFSFVRNKITK